jgi:formylmethanofuran dehydrogenase subunit D
MIRLQFLLVTGRTVDQGCSKESGKLSRQYAESVAVCEMNSEDLEKLKIEEGQKVQVSTEYGSVVVKAMKSLRIKTSGTVFIPYGPWANAVLSSSTNGTGMPLLKGVKATVEPTDAEFLGLPELLYKTFGKAKNAE